LGGGRGDVRGEKEIAPKGEHRKFREAEKAALPEKGG